MDNNKDFLDKLLLTLESKPRASKTSTRQSVRGLNFFFKCSEAGTGGNIVIYYDAPPYPRIKVIAAEIVDNNWLKGNDERFIKKAKNWIESNYEEIVKRLKNINSRIVIPESIWQESEKK